MMQTKTFNRCHLFSRPITADDHCVIFKHPLSAAPYFLCVDASGAVLCGVHDKPLTPAQFIRTLSEWYFVELSGHQPGPIEGTRTLDPAITAYDAWLYQVRISHPSMVDELALLSSAAGNGLMLRRGADGQVEELDLQQLRALLTNWFAEG